MSLILGIETSCDETAASVVEEVVDEARPWRLRSSVVASQVDIHREWGGVVPELASRQHVRDICGVVERALGDAGVGWPALDALAVTQGPGLVGSLLVGVAFAKAAAWPSRVRWCRCTTRRAHRVDLAGARPGPAAGRCPRRLRRPHQPLSRSRPRRVPPARAHP
ncbi:MAG: hypothetical protein R2712_01235 [Vicinamibacterales bacterium]